MKIGLFEGDFQHAFSTTLWKHPTYFEWDKGVLQETSFFIDRAIVKNIGTECPTKFAWVVESRVIIPDVIVDFKRHYKEISAAYKYVFTHYRELYELADNFIYMPPHGYWIEKSAIYPKTKLVSLVSSTKRFGPGHDYR